MRPPPAGVRRAVLDPLWLPLAAALAALLLVVAAVGGLAWPVTRRRRVPRLALLGALYVLVDAIMLMACAGLWLRHPVASARDDERWQDAHLRLLRWTLARLRSAATTLVGFTMTVEEPPDPARMDGGPLLVLARHAGPGDSFALVDLLLSRYGRRPRIVLKEDLLWDPGLDVVLSRLSACFLPAHAGDGEELAERVAGLARGLRGRDAMLIFPEGLNWTPHRYRRALSRLLYRADWRVAAQAARNPYVLPPRPAGVLASLAARPDLDVVVVAHTGLDDLVSPALVWRALPLAGRPMTVRWWREPASDVPPDPAGQLQWLQLQWAIVDSWIESRKARAAAADGPDSADPDSAGPDSAGPDSAGPADPDPDDDGQGAGLLGSPG
ncbi:MAG: 1-acyl-sn-glycerol-3-phosphate acyltransferase [Streptosporangiaceae bacterium]